MHTKRVIISPHYPFVERSMPASPKPFVSYDIQLLIAYLAYLIAYYTLDIHIRVYTKYIEYIYALCRHVIYDLVWYGMVWFVIVWFCMILYDMVGYGMVWYGRVWYGMVWYGMVWYGMIWYGMVWYGMRWGDLIYHKMIWVDLPSLGHSG